MHLHTICIYVCMAYIILIMFIVILIMLTIIEPGALGRDGDPPQLSSSSCGVEWLDGRVAWGLAGRMA